MPAVPNAPHHAKAVQALGRVAIGTLWTSRQVIREFLAVMSRPQTFFAGHAPMPDILDRARTIESQCRVAEDGPDVAQQLHALLAVGDTRGKQIHDANIVATMLATVSGPCSRTTSPTSPDGATSSTYARSAPTKTASPPKVELAV